MDATTGTDQTDGSSANRLQPIVCIASQRCTPKLAIASALRRAPRAAAAARALLAALGSPRSGRVGPPHPRAAPVAPLSSLSAPKPSAVADAQLLRVITYEISRAQLDCRNRNWAKELGEGFPFEIRDKEGTSRITLTRTHQDERIEVEALLPSPVAGAAQDDGEQEEDDQAEDGKKQSQAGGGVPNQYCIPLTVRIRKGVGAASCLEIGCRSYPTGFVVERLEFGSSDESAGGTAFSGIPGELQKALHLYLGSRGISAHFTDFMHAYMITKECHEYLSWLRELKGLVKG
ncbi:uncharacterized protein At2g39795, mitochondrial [Triticum aestivum]|uniref:uncharacterized protein At2g39795, mitochondrial n=1 Tax=Triticum aestivum TaxID=4565 RepID=UPI001D02D18F|nr:uncharacterized protein At2g39795, mitochondrial-like [Triticum aestivum]